MEAMQFQSLAIKANEVSIQNIKKEVDFNDAPDEFRGIKESIFKVSKYSLAFLNFRSIDGYFDG